MSNRESLIGGIAERYATALFELTLEQSKTAQSALSASVADFAALLDGSADLRRLLASPIIEIAEKQAALAAVLKRAKTPEIMQKFVALVLQNGRGLALLPMCRAYLALVAEARNELRAEVITATPLAAAQSAALVKKLTAASGKSVTIDAKTDPSLLGGLIVKLGSRMVDASLRTQLNALKRAMNEAG